jgi:hypothetical protein
MTDARSLRGFCGQDVLIIFVFAWLHFLVDAIDRQDLNRLLQLGDGSLQPLLQRHEGLVGEMVDGCQLSSCSAHLFKRIVAIDRIE